jgi:hypothetical protein
MAEKLYLAYIETEDGGLEPVVFTDLAQAKRAHVGHPSFLGGFENIQEIALNPEIPHHPAFVAWRWDKRLCVAPNGIERDRVQLGIPKDARAFGDTEAEAFANLLAMESRLEQEKVAA